MNPPEIRSLYNRYRALLRQSHKRWAQNSRLNWIDGGDPNSAFFHRSVRVRRHHNFISSIKDFEGNTVLEHRQIENTLVKHFSALLSNKDQRNFDTIFNALPNDHHCLSPTQRISLTKHVIIDEVHKTILSLPVSKSPSPDGLNVEFFKFFWEDLGDNLFAAVNHFFHHAVMPKAWGKTYIVLIPKKEHPN